MKNFYAIFFLLVLLYMAQVWYERKYYYTKISNFANEINANYGYRTSSGVYTIKFTTLSYMYTVLKSDILLLVQLHFCLHNIYFTVYVCVNKSEYA